MVGLFSDFLFHQRIKLVKPFLSGSILDIGCGYTPVLRALPGGAEYIGVDKWPDALKYVRSKYPNETFITCDIDRERLVLPGKYKTIVMMAVLEHLENPDLIFSQIPTFLAPGGKLVISTPTVMGNFIHHLGAKIRLFSSEAAEEHHIIYRLSTLRKLLNGYDLKILAYRTYLLGGNQLCIAGFKDAAS
jgi:2-polyprenyl-3-methyl-5-hydroxy-6-metoxy-1,4-benzoquinol methylase